MNDYNEIGFALCNFLLVIHIICLFTFITSLYILQGEIGEHEQFLSGKKKNYLGRGVPSFIDLIRLFVFYTIQIRSISVSSKETRTSEIPTFEHSRNRYRTLSAGVSPIRPSTSMQPGGKNGWTGASPLPKFNHDRQTHFMSVFISHIYFSQKTVKGLSKPQITVFDGDIASWD